MKQNNGWKWDKNFVVAVIAIFVAIATPELRKLFCLEKDKPESPPPAVLTQPQSSSMPAAPSPVPTLKVQPEASKPATGVQPKQKQHVENPKPPSGPFSATLHENQPQFIEEAETGLSVIFNEEYSIVTLTIAPDGRQSSNHAVLNGYSEEFISSKGDFLVHILHADWNSRTVTVQVSRKSHQTTAFKDKD